jgi:hypothetical protein
VLPLMSVICVAAGMVVPVTDSVLASAGLWLDLTMALTFVGDGELPELVPPHAAIVRHNAANAALKTLFDRRMLSP